MPTFPLDQEPEVLPYPTAPLPVQTVALQCLPTLFGTSFATLSWEQWHQVFTVCYPALVVTPSSVELEEQDYQRIATYLTLQYGTDEARRAVFADNRARHVARKLLYFSRRAQLALAQVAALSETEQADALALYQAVLQDLTSGDVLADEIVRAHAFQVATPVAAAPPIPNQGSRKAAPPLISPRSVQEQPQEWVHLQQWFAQNQDTARPWNVSAISRHLKLTQSAARALLTAPKGAAGMSRTAFSRSRLRQLQRYFAPYGYTPPGN